MLMMFNEEVQRVLEDALLEQKLSRDTEGRLAEPLYRASSWVGRAIPLIRLGCCFCLFKSLGLFQLIHYSALSMY